MNRRILTIAFLSTALIFTACDTKDEIESATNPTTNPTSTPSNPTPNFATGKGTLSAVQVRSFQEVPVLGEIEVNLGIAVAAFYDDPSSQTFLDGGEVKCNSYVLTKQSNNAYAYTPDNANPEGIDFSSNTVTWEVAGNGSIPTISETFTNSFPDVKNITSASTVTKASGYTLTCGGISGADSALFLVGDVIHTVVGGVTSSTFTSAELANLGAGSSVVQIAAYNFTSKATGSETFNYVKETVVNKTVTVQ